MNLAGLDLNLLVAFEAIAAERGISRAAARLGLRQPALSAALARLRLLFGDELFVRAAGEMQPTPKALRLIPAIDGALARIRAALAEDVPFSPAGAPVTFTLAATDYTTRVLLPGLVAAIEAEAPETVLRVIGYDKDDIAGLIDRGQIDLALGVFREPPPRAVRQLLCAERFVGVARAGHPGLVGGAMTLSAYLAARHALVSVRRDATGEIDRILALSGQARHVALTLPHMLALPELLAASDLVAALPERIARHVAGSALAIFELPFAAPSWRIEMLWNPVARADQANAWLRARVMAVARSV